MTSVQDLQSSLSAKLAQWVIWIVFGRQGCRDPAVCLKPVACQEVGASALYPGTYLCHLGEGMTFPRFMAAEPVGTCLSFGSLPAGGCTLLATVVDWVVAPPKCPPLEMYWWKWRWEQCTLMMDEGATSHRLQWCLPLVPLALFSSYKHKGHHVTLQWAIKSKFLDPCNLTSYHFQAQTTVLPLAWKLEGHSFSFPAGQSGLALYVCMYLFIFLV